MFSGYVRRLRVLPELEFSIARTPLPLHRLQAQERLQRTRRRRSGQPDGQDHQPLQVPPRKRLLRSLLQAAPLKPSPQPEVRLRRFGKGDGGQAEGRVRLPVHFQARGHVQGHHLVGHPQRGVQGITKTLSTNMLTCLVRHFVESYNRFQCERRLKEFLIYSFKWLRLRSAGT